MTDKMAGPRRPGRLAAMLLAVGLALAVSAVAAADPLEPVTVQLRWRHQFQFAGYYAALEKGYYREAGLDVTLVEGGPQRDPIEEVLSGRAQYGAASNELLMARLAGKPVKVLAAVFQQSPSVFLALGSSGIDSPQGMRGKRVMLMKGTGDAELLAVLRKAGIALEDIRRLDTSFDCEDLLAGRTDVFNAYLTNEPYYLEQRGIAAAIIRPADYDILFYGDCVFTSEEEIDWHPRRVRGFHDATLKGWQYAMDHPAEMIDLILAKYRPDLTRDHLRYEAATMYELIKPGMIQIGHMNPARWQHMAETLVAVGMVPPDLSRLEGLTYDPRAGRDLTPLLWMGGAGLVLFLTVGAVAIGLARLNRRLRRAMEERGRAEQRFATMAARVPGALFNLVVLPDGSRQYTYLSPGAEAFFGLPAEAVIREERRLNLHPDDRERVEEQLSAACQASAKVDLEGRVIPAGGEEKWINLTAAPSLLPGGELAYDGFILDITARKQAEMASLANERKLQAMSQAVDDALVMLDSRGRVRFWNPAAERLFGYTAEEAMGQVLHTLAASPDQREKAAEGFKHFALTGQGPIIGTTTEAMAVDRQGRTFPVEITISACQVDQEWYSVGTVRDISERKRVEDEMNRQIRDLERFNRLTVGREERMIRLKEEVNDLLEQTGREKKYRIVDATDNP